MFGQRLGSEMLAFHFSYRSLETAQTLINISAVPIPSVLIPESQHSSNHLVFCYSSESGNSVKRLKPDPDPDDKTPGGCGPLLSSFPSL